jgi:hypothetical protein
LIYCLTWAVHDARTNLRTINRKLNLGKNVSLNWFMSGWLFYWHHSYTRYLSRNVSENKANNIHEEQRIAIAAEPWLLSYTGMVFLWYTCDVWSHKKDIRATVPQLLIIYDCCRATCVVFARRGANLRRREFVVYFALTDSDRKDASPTGEG